MWEDSQYCWVVFCKNHFYHIRQNLFHRHRIPLGVTDAIASRPVIDARFSVRYDDCGKEYLYAPSEVVRYKQDPRNRFSLILCFAKKTDSRYSVQKRNSMARMNS